MRHHIGTLTCLCSILLTVCAVPLPANSNEELDVLQVPLQNGKELDILTLGTKEELTDRNKRTIGLLRELFPEITKQIDEQANRIISKVLRVLGPTVLRAAVQGNNPSINRSNNFDSDFDDDDDDDIGNGNDNSSTGKDDNGTRVSIELPTFSPDDDFANENESSSSSSSISPSSSTSSNSAASNIIEETSSEDANNQGDGSIDLAALNKQLEETIRVARQASEAAAKAGQQEQQQSQDPIISNEVQQLVPAPIKNQTSTTNQQSTESKAPAIDELSLDSDEDALDDDDRNKRFLPFGGSSGGAAVGGGGGGSGNFLFDIVRLFSGSVQTQTGDEAANDVGNGGDSTDDNSADSDANRADDGYTEGIPGPVTRFVVLANRGLASLIQDLILRIAATSERLVNFKAKLITALI